ncbi:hypothetical protein LCGC14_0550420 [marine sediment metagenome]|uniref:Trimeric autotransporter adhesin YadA-like head domain-containing protein n=1 Tax=marine sediment metagenome TaxID=412755 RepID=A0A0F9UYD6_9ZZZZ
MTTLLDLTDTPIVYDDGKYLRSVVSGTEWAKMGFTPPGLTISNYVRSPGIDNTLAGKDAGAAIAADAANNVIVGDSAGASQTTADFNTIVGADAGLTLTTAKKSTLIGYRAGRDLSTGKTSDLNTFVGYQTGYNASSGFSNVFVGALAGQNTIGQENTFVGTSAGGGKSPGNGNSNVCIGNESGTATITATKNVFVGAASGRRTVSGQENVYIGCDAAYYNQYGAKNVCIGYRSAYGVLNKSYSNNTLLGYQSGYSLIVGGSNVFIGYQAGYNETGSNKLYIENSNSATPLIYGEFDNDLVKINGSLEVTDGIINHGPILTSNGTYRGDVLIVTVDDASASFGNPVYCADDFHYERANAVSITTMPCRAIALESGSGSKKILLSGQICNTSWNWSNGDIFVDVNAGAFTQISPVVSGSQVQVVGYALSADTMYFNPII